MWTALFAKGLYMNHRIRRMPNHMIGVINNNIVDLLKHGYISNSPDALIDFVKNACNYYNVSAYTEWKILKYGLNCKDKHLNICCWLYEDAFQCDKTVTEYSVHLYNKYFPNTPKYPYTDRKSKKFTIIDLPEEDINGAF